MRTTGFETWLRTERRMRTNTISSRISNCKRVEKHEGDLDVEFDTDGLRSLLSRLTYSSSDAQAGKPPKHRIRIDGNACEGTKTLKNAVSLYRDFRLLSRAKTDSSSDLIAKKIDDLTALVQELSARYDQRFDGIEGVLETLNQGHAKTKEQHIEILRILREITGTNRDASG